MNKTLSALFFAALMLPAAALLAQTTDVCPDEIQGQARCYTGVDQNGAHYWIAIPADWNQSLVMHAHGGPRLKPIDGDDNLNDLKRFAVTVQQGFAWAGSSYRRPGYGVRMAAEDTENLRQIFVKAFGKPAHTIFHGQSWGGNVAAKGIELYGVNADGTRNYDAAVLTSGMLAGGTLNYLHRADLRAVYQYYCNNHPRPDEPQYPLWMGLPADSRLTGKDVAERINACTGFRLPVEKRSAAQARNLANILAVIKVPERALAEHMSWATLMFRDVTQRVLGGRNPFFNRNAVYHGSDDDAALNRGVARFDADPQALALLADDSDMSGQIPVPVMTMHAIGDPTAMIEYEARYKDVISKAGNDKKLVQVFTTEQVHSKLSEAEYAGLFDVLMQWVVHGEVASAEKVAAACAKQAQRFKGGCHVDTAYVPQPLFSRVAPR